MAKIRIIVQHTDYGAACHVGGPVSTEYVTFDVEAPELVAHMSATVPSHGHRSVVGVEILKPDATP